MRQRLVECAMLVFAEKGIGASVIQDVISAANVSQGTFYNYFRTNDELLVAISEELNNELLRMIESEVGGYEDPAKRIACGLRLYLHTTRVYPLVARFVASAGLRAVGPNTLIYEYLPPHIEAGIAAGRFQAIPVNVALDLIAGTALAAVVRIAAGDCGQHYTEQVVATILRGLGVSAAQSARLIGLPMKPMKPPATSLLERGNGLFRSQVQQPGPGATAA